MPLAGRQKARKEKEVLPRALSSSVTPSSSEAKGRKIYKQMKRYSLDGNEHDDVDVLIVELGEGEGEQRPYNVNNNGAAERRHRVAEGPEKPN